jgi:hypothetical protein
LKWTEDLNVAPEIEKLLEENIKGSLTLVLAVIFFNIT